MHQITFPMTMTLFLGAGAYAGKRWKNTFFAMNKTLPWTFMAKVTKKSSERLLLFVLFGILADPAINAFKGNMTCRIVGKFLSQTACNLLRRPLIPQSLLHIGGKKSRPFSGVLVF